MKTALVVGGSSTIGTAIADSLAGCGYAVELWGRDRARLEQAAEQVRASGGSASWAGVDVTDRAALTAAVGALCERARLAVAVWAAGAFDWGSADRADPASWDQVLDVNLAAAAHWTRLVLPGLVAEAPSSLLYLGSGAARRAYPWNAAYVASKHGLRGLAEAVWLDVRQHGVKVSLVSPGLVAAGAGLESPQGRSGPETLLQADDVAAAVRFVVTFPARGCPTEVRLEPQSPVEVSG